MTLKVCLKKVSCLLQISLHILDLGTDILTLLKYKDEQSITVFGIALGSIILSLPVGIAYYIYQFRVCYGRNKSENTMITIKLLEVLLESVVQLLINLYILSSCGQRISLVQYISAGISFLSICVAVVHFDTTIKLHSEVSIVQKLFILTYRCSYLAARLLAFVYFTFYLGWWSSALVISHWAIGCLCLGYDKDSTILRSVVAILLNTIVYIGEASGLKALAILLLYSLENVIMVAIPFMVVTLQNDATIEVPITRFATDGITVATIGGNIPYEMYSTMENSEFNSTTRKNAAVLVSNDFHVQTNSDDVLNLVSGTDNSTVSSLEQVAHFCLYPHVLTVNGVLNFLAVTACIFYALSLHYKWCMKDNKVVVENPEQEIQKPKSLIILESEL